MMNQRAKELFKNTAIIGIGRISTQIVTFLLIPLYANKLSTQEFGTFDLYTSSVSLLLPLITLQIELAVYKCTILNRTNQNKIKMLFSTATVFICGGIIIFFMLFLGINNLVEIKDFYLLSLYIIASAIFLLENNIVRALGDNFNYAIAGVIVSVVTITCNIFVLCVFHMGVRGLLFSVIISNFLGSLYLFFRNHLFRYFAMICVSKIELKNMLSYSIPLIPNELSWWVIKGSDRVVVTIFLGVGVNGVLAIGMKFASIFQSFINIFIIAWTENVILYHKKGRESFNQLVNQLIFLFGWLAIFIIIGIGFIFKYMVAGEYVDSYFLIPLYIVAIYVNCIGGLFGAVYLAENRTMAVTKSTLIAGIVNLLSDIVMIKWLGLYAAGISSILGYLVMAVYRIHHLKRDNKFVIEKQGLIYVIVGLLVAMIGYSGSVIMKLGSGLIALILFGIANKSVLKLCAEKIKGK